VNEKASTKKFVVHSIKATAAAESGKYEREETFLCLRNFSFFFIIMLGGIKGR
jgi:hypothetical protein